MEFCMCHVCEEVVSVDQFEGSGCLDAILELHTEDCFLANALHDVLNDPEILTAQVPVQQQSQIAQRQSPQPRGPHHQSPHPPSPSSPQFPPREPPSCPQSPSPQSSSPQSVLHQPTPRTSSSFQKHQSCVPSYASVAASYPQQESTTLPRSPSITRHSPFSQAALPALTPTRPSQQPEISPTLSIHDLSRRFQNQPNPFSTPQSLQQTPITRLLYAIADLLEHQIYNTGQNSRSHSRTPLYKPSYLRV
jgi:hypothetical protein